MIVFLLKMVWACEDLASVPDALQVAWISPVRSQVRYKEQINVVRYSDLQKYVKNERPNTTQLLQHMGMKRGKIRREISADRYKLVIFDVTSESMCRPIEIQEGDESVQNTSVTGLSVCKEKRALVPFRKSQELTRKGDSGCGYLINTQSLERTFDVYRISWADASAQGFCVLPLSRFLSL